MNILIISYHFPPGKNSQAQHAYNLTNILSRKNKVEVLTAGKNNLIQRSFVSGDVTIHDIGKGILHRGSKKNQGDQLIENKEPKISKNRYISKLKKLLVPDPVIDWYPIALKWLKAKTGDFDIVISIATPYTDLLIGNRFIKNHKNTSHRPKHILIYADPWAGEESIKRKKLRSYFEGKLEFQLLQKSDLVFMVTKNALQDYIKRYPCITNKAYSYYLGHNVKEIYWKRNQSKSDIVEFRYFGSIQSVHRNPYALFDVLDCEYYSNKIKLDMYLLPHVSHKSIIRRVKSSEYLSRIVSFLKPVPYEEMLKISSNNGINLVLGNKSITQIPGKLFDYIGVQSTILYLESNINNEINSILQGYNSAYICKNEYKEIKSTLDQIIYNQENNIELMPSTEIYESILVKNSYKIVQDKIDEILSMSSKQ